MRTGPLAMAIAALAVATALASAWMAHSAWLAGIAHAPDLEAPGYTLILLLQAGCAILTFVWLYRAVERVRKAGAQGLSVGPWGAVGWWFVPLANLFMPVRIVAELRKAAIDPRDWQAVTGSILIALWWTCWIGAGLANAALVVAGQDGDEFVAFAGRASFFGDVLTVPAALLFAAVVLTIDRHLRHIGEKI